MRGNMRGQITAETAVLFTFVIVGFVLVGFYLQRGVQGSTKANADSLGSQYSTTSGWYSYSASDSHEASSGTTTSTSCGQTLHQIGGTASPLNDCGDRTLHEATGAAVQSGHTYQAPN